jgi:hypothetical protein
MTIATNKLQMFFTTPEGYGWSEDYNWSGGIGNPNNLQPVLDNFATKRLAFASADVVLVWIRIATQYKRDPLIYDYTPRAGFKGAINTRVNDVMNAVLIRIESNGTGYNKLFTRGVPDTVVIANEFVPDSEWLGGFNAFQSYVLNSGNLAVVASVDNPNPPVPIASLSQGDPKGIIMVLKPTFSVPFPGKVRITGASFVGYNGVKNVIDGPPNQAALTYILGGARPNANQPAANAMKATPITPTAGLPTACFYEGLSTRKPGRFFGQRRGRARTTLSLRP